MKEFVVYKVLGEDYAGPIYLDDAVNNVIYLLPDDMVIDYFSLAEEIKGKMKYMNEGEHKVIYGVPVDCVDVEDGDEDNIRECSVCHNMMQEGHYNEDDGEYFCSEECLTKNLGVLGVNWRWDEEKNSAGGYITQLFSNGETNPCNIYYTEWWS